MSKKKTVPKDAAKTAGKLLSIGYPQTGLGLFSNHMLAQDTGTEFHLSFFQLQPPFIVGTDDDTKAAVEKLERITAEPVARIIVPHSLIPSIIEVLEMAARDRRFSP